MPYSKKAAVERDGYGKVVKVLEVVDISQAGELQAYKDAALATQKEAESAKKAKEEKESKEAKERAQKAAQSDYWAKWRFAMACQSVLLLWLAEDPNTSKDESAQATQGLLACLNGESGGTSKELLALYPLMGKAYEGLFGKEPENE